ncbi:kelch-like protein 22 isoform X1 [Pieris rapae]|uniref:kelch-like protein 22 isoform X1 n=1 Tax=Pieris rapae TaxID=64459 RepID=UPI001E27A4F1|nr:kelch-like protein 22 isoform X1 [Pieris rapae]
MDISEKTHVKYSLSWSDHLQAISNGLCSLQQNEELVDMTLAADGHYVKVHRVIMAMASPYMKDLICSIKCNHPVIFLNNLSYNTLTYILEYIYTGKVDIPSEFMDEFLIAGRSLHIKGLKDVNVKDEDIIIPVKDTDMDQVKMSKCYTEAATKNEREVLDLELIKENMKESLTKSIGSLEVETIEEDGEIIVDTENPDCDISTHYTLSNRGSLQMILNKFMYYLKHTNKDNSRQWRCVDYLTKNKCPALIFTEGDLVIQRISAHNHKAHENKITKRFCSGKVYTTIREAEENTPTKNTKDCSENYMDHE